MARRHLLTILHAVSFKGENLHPRVLREIVGADLNAMEDFKNHRQLQKNVLLTICNDHILQEVNFDRYFKFSSNS